MASPGTLLLSRADVAALLGLDECIEAVEEALRLQGKGRTPPAGILGFPRGDGGFHVKAAGLDRARPYFAVKINGNFPRNRERFGMPTIQGVIALQDAENGYPLALMDSIEITLLRTGAATAVAAKYLARADSRVAAICGCGSQGRVQLRALARVLPIERARVFDADPEAAERFARELGPELGIAVEPVGAAGLAARESDVCVTCTPSRKAFLARKEVPPGCFIAAVGADAPEKRELETALLASARVVVDSLQQCATIGELHHALDDGAMAKSAVHAELSEIVAGLRPGRESSDEVTIFDSTGIALYDVAAAALAFEKARDSGRGSVWEFGGTA